MNFIVAGISKPDAILIVAYFAIVNRIVAGIDKPDAIPIVTYFAIVNCYIVCIICFHASTWPPAATISYCKSFYAYSICSNIYNISAIASIYYRCFFILANEIYSFVYNNIFIIYSAVNIYSISIICIIYCILYGAIPCIFI